MSSWVPTKKALSTGLILAVVILAPLFGVAYVVGGKGVLAAAMGVMAAAVVPFATFRQTLFLVPALAVAGATAAWAHGNPVAVVSVVVISCLLAGTLSVLSAGIFGVAPIVVAVLALDGADGVSPTQVGLIMLVVGAYVTAVVWILKLHRPPQPIPLVVAVRHALVMAVACGVTTAVAVHFDWPRSYWLVMTMAIVLRPYAQESWQRTRERTIGTVLGAIVAALMSPLPRPWQILFAAFCMMLMFAYLTMGKYALQVTFMTPMVVFLVSSGKVDSTLSLDGLRVLYTISACVIGGLLAMVLARDPAMEAAET